LALIDAYGVPTQFVAYLRAALGAKRPASQLGGKTKKTP